MRLFRSGRDFSITSTQSLGRPDTSTHRSLWVVSGGEDRRSARKRGERTKNEVRKMIREGVEVVLELERNEWRGDGLEPLLQQRSQIVRARACKKESMEWAKIRRERA